MKSLSLEELKEQVMVVPFVDLEPHVQREAVFVLREGLDLAQVGRWVAQDHREEIARLLSENLLVKATFQDVSEWREQKRFFSILIVQPFVLAQNFSALAGTI